VRIDILTIFPEFFSVLDVSLVGKARQSGLIDLSVHDLRDFTHDRHRTVDDTPYGGGAGMVMKPEPWGEALDSILAGATGDAGATPEAPGIPVMPRTDSPVTGRSDTSTIATPAAPAMGMLDTPVATAARAEDAVDLTVASEGGFATTVIFPSPAGERFTQATARELALSPHLVFGCGRYEGIDQRVIEHTRTRANVREISLGDYVLNGGEVASMAMIEAIGRLVPGMVGNPESLTEESHEDGLLEYPSYTKPSSWRGMDVPPVLLSGNHGKIAEWRHSQQVERTERVRPDLLRG
jgi:tRNA (guanine37-N1)-methyltransferase